MLENINARPGITIVEISRRAPQTQQALSQIAARKLGYIERRLADRGRAISLTTAGAQARTSAHEAIETFETKLATALGSSRHTRLIKLLDETRATLGDLRKPRRRVS